MTRFTAGGLGLYVPGTSWLHRTGPGVKLLGLSAVTSLMVVTSSPAVVTSVAVLVVALVLSSGVGLPVWWAQLRPVLWMAAVVALTQWWSRDARSAYVAVGGLLVSIGCAALLTLTTRTEALMDSLVSWLGPLRPLGVDPERVALLVALTVRAIPVLSRIVSEADQARIARGAPRSVRALVVPTTVRTVRYADRLGEAMIARGLDD